MSRLLRPSRVMGVDVARGIALIGMMATHIISSFDPADGSVSLSTQVASGRASALFAVLAGVSLALVTGGGTPVAGARLEAARRSTLVRAAVIAVIGLTLGALGSPVAVILVSYGVLFVVAAPFLGLRWRVLAPLGAAWLLFSPVLAHALRTPLPLGPGPVTSWLSLAAPGELVSTLLLTGYYPVLQWTGYLLVGLAVGRLPLRRPATAAWLVVSGAALAVVAKATSSLLLARGFGELTVPPGSPIAGRPLNVALDTGIYGTTPTTSWWWLAVSGPHSGTPFDLVHTTGTALLVLGLCLLVTNSARRALLPLAAAGSMTLTLYSLHVVALAATAGPRADWDQVVEYAVHVVVAVAAASLWSLTGQRGPLEAATSDLSRAATSGRARLQ